MTLFVRMRRAGFVRACIFGIRDLIAIFVGHRAAWTRWIGAWTRRLEQTLIHRIEHAVFVAVHGRAAQSTRIWRCALRFRRTLIVAIGHTIAVTVGLGLRLFGQRTTQPIGIWRQTLWRIRTEVGLVRHSVAVAIGFDRAAVLFGSRLATPFSVGQASYLSMIPSPSPSGSFFVSAGRRQPAKSAHVGRPRLTNKTKAQRRTDLHGI